MPEQIKEITVGNMETIIREVVEQVLGGIRQGFPIAKQYDNLEEPAWLATDEVIRHLITVAINEFRNESEPDKYEFALDAIKDTTTQLVKWYNNLKPNYQSR